MLRKQLPEEENTDVNLTPMLDVTFILLIFFIVTSTFIKIPGVEVEKVAVDNGSPVKSPIVVAVDSNNSIWVDRKKIQPRETYSIMQEFIEDNPGATAMIQVDGESRNGVLLELMETMMSAGMIRIDIITSPRE